MLAAIAGTILAVGLAAAAFDLILTVLGLALRYWWVWALLGIAVIAAG